VDIKIDRRWSREHRRLCWNGNAMQMMEVGKQKTEKHERLRTELLGPVLHT
jgi:hypothetical protein